MRSLPVFVVFALNGVLLGSWSGRVPALSANVHAGPGGLGLALLGTSVGLLLAAPFTGRLCVRFGTNWIVAGSALAGCLLLPLLGLATSIPLLGVALLLLGASSGMLDVAMNVLAVSVIRALDRPLMPIFHAAFSFGGLAGALGASLASHADWSSLRQFLVVATLGIAAVAAALRTMSPQPTRTPLGSHPMPGSEPTPDTGLWPGSATTPGPGPGPTAHTHPTTPAARRVPSAHATTPDAQRTPDTHRQHGDHPTTPDALRTPDTQRRRSDRPQRDERAARKPLIAPIRRRVLWLLATAVLCSAVAEGACSDWSALFLVRERGVDPSLAATGYAAFSVAMACSRLFGERWERRWGPHLVVGAGGALAAMGFLAAALVPFWLVGYAGFILAGAGLAFAFPVGLSLAGAAGRRADGHGGEHEISFVTTIAYGGFLAGPPLIGFVAQATNLSVALGLVGVIALVMAPAAASARHARQREVSRQTALTR